MHLDVRFIEKKIFFFIVEPPYRNAVQELFIWSVLMNNQDLAKLFWNLGKVIKS